MIHSSLLREYLEASQIYVSFLYSNYNAHIVFLGSVISWKCVMVPPALVFLCVITFMLSLHDGSAQGFCEGGHR